MITFLRSTVVTALGGGFMRNTNKSISRAIPSCMTAEIFKRNSNVRNAFDIINGTSAVISESEPESKPCSFDG